MDGVNPDTLHSNCTQKPDVRGLRWVCCSLWKGFNIICVSYLPSLHLFGGHDNDSRVLLKHHPPEVTDGVLQAALSGDVALLQLGAVNLVVQLRLHGDKQTESQLSVQKQTIQNKHTTNRTCNRMWQQHKDNIFHFWFDCSTMFKSSWDGSNNRPTQTHILFIHISTCVCACVWACVCIPEDDVSLPWQQILPWWYWRWCSQSPAHLGPCHSAPHECGRLQTEEQKKIKTGECFKTKPERFSWERLVVKQQSSVSHRAECSCICSCFCSPLSGPPYDCRAACTLVAAKSGWKTERRVKSWDFPTNHARDGAGRAVERPDRTTHLEFFPEALFDFVCGLG